MRAVIDANVFVSFLLSKGDTVSFIIDEWENETFDVLVTYSIFIELDDVIDRVTKSNKGAVDRLDAAAMKRRLLKNTIRVNTISDVNISKDSKDNRYLVCAKDGQADYLVTGDKKHLLSLKKFGNTRIVSPKEFVEILRKSI